MEPKPSKNDPISTSVVKNGHGNGYISHKHINDNNFTRKNSLWSDSAQNQLDTFLRNVQMMLLNFYNNGTAIKNVEKYYIKTFPVENLPEPRVYGFKTIEELLRSKYAKPFFIILIHKANVEKPDIIRAKSLDPMKYFMLKKGRDLLRIVRSSTRPEPAQEIKSETNNDQNEGRLSEESGRDKTVSESRNEESTNADSVKVTNRSINTPMTQNNINCITKVDVETWQQAIVRNPVSTVSPISLKENTGQKIQLTQQLSKDLPKRDISLEENYAYLLPPDVMLRGRHIRPLIHTTRELLPLEKIVKVDQTNTQTSNPSIFDNFELFYSRRPS